MRKLLPFLVVGILVLSGLGAVNATVKETELKTESTISFSQPVIKSEEEFATVNIAEANSYLTEQQGKPMIPTYTQTFAFPFGTKIKSVTCTPGNIQTQTLSKDITPSPKAVVLGQTATTTQNEPINYGTETYPSSWFEYNVAGGRYNNELSVIVDVEVNLVKYHPVKKTIEYIKDVNIVIGYETSTKETTYRDDYKLVIIGPSDFSSALAPLVAHKIARGITTKFVSLDDIYNGVYFPAQGVDNQEKIKYFIKDAIENWATGNILLVGSNTKLPARTTHVAVDNGGGTYDKELLVSDLYYADIYDATGAFCDWDYNGNGVFGEYAWDTGCSGNCDKVDLHPDIYLGRLACTDSSQVTACVNKIIYYEDNVAYQKDWYLNLVVVGGDSFPDNKNVNEGEYINDKVVGIMNSFIPTYVNVTNGKLTNPILGDQYVNDAINAGCGFVDFDGHGAPYIWATHPHMDFNTWVPRPYGGYPVSASGVADVESLSNGNMLPIVTVEACDTSQFNTNSNCFNWAFMHNSNGGAIGTFGATGLGYGYTGTGVSTGLIGKIGLDTYRACSLDQSTTLGEMWAKALNRYIKSNMQDADFKTVEEWQVFGDPTLQISAESQPPAKPAKPSGPTNGLVGTEYTYTTTTTDPEGNKIYYMFSWGDGTTSGWVGPFNSGATGSANKIWNKRGTYEIKVLAKDEHGKLSSWSDPMSTTMPRSTAYYDIPLLKLFLERFPNTFPILRLLLKL